MLLTWNTGYDSVYQWAGLTPSGQFRPLTPDVHATDITVTTTGAPGTNAIRFPPGQRPRHLKFHEKHPKYAIIANEGNGTRTPMITLCGYDSHKGLTPLRDIPTMETSSEMDHLELSDMYPGEVLFSPSGEYLYVSNRDASTALRDNIAVFDVSSLPELKLIENVPSGGSYPRSIALSGDGQTLWVGNQKSNSTILFHVNQQTGRLDIVNKSREIYHFPAAFVAFQDL